MLPVCCQGWMFLYTSALSSRIWISMPVYAGSPCRGERSATPLLPPLGSLYCRRSSKSPYSFSVISQPPLPLTPSTPFLTVHASVLPLWAFQPSVSLPLNSFEKPFGGESGSVSSARAGRVMLSASSTAKAGRDRDTVQLRHGVADI